MEVCEIVGDALWLDLLNEQVGLVEEQDDGHRPEAAVVDDGVEDVDALHQSVGHPVL